MNSNITANLSIELLQKDYKKEAENLYLLGGETLRYAARGLIWHICSHFGINYGIGSKSCRILELYIASLVGSQSKNQSIINIADYVMSKVNPDLPLLAACCFQLAVKSSCRASGAIHRNADSSVAMRNFFLVTGILDYSVISIRQMEKKIFKRIGFEVPLYTSLDMAGLLAMQLGLPLPTLRLAITIVEGAELYRHNIQRTLLYAIKKERITCNTCLMTLPLAASSVVTAAVKDLQLMNAIWVVDRLEALLSISKVYLRVLSQVILLEVKGINTFL